MILEHAIMSITPGREAEFLEALEQAKLVLARARGYQGIWVQQGIERPSSFLLSIGWETLADHTENFRGGELFPEWRAIIGPFFAEPPQVEHWQPIG